jgi:oligopeptidase B
MRTSLILVCIIFISGCDYVKKKPDPPHAKKIRKELTIHGHTRIDDYYWLKERDNDQVISYLESENAYTDAAFGHTENLQQTLFEEIIGRIKQTDESVPYFKNGYHYYSRYESGQEFPIYCRKKGSMEADEEVMLNVNEMAKGYDYYSVRGVRVSPDNNNVAFGVDTLSRRKYTIHVKNLSTGKLFLDAVPNTTGAPVWANDNSTIFYTRKDHTLRPYKVFSRKIKKYIMNRMKLLTPASGKVNRTVIFLFHHPVLYQKRRDLLKPINLNRHSGLFKTEKKIMNIPLPTLRMIFIS